MTERTDRPRPRTYEKHPESVWQAIRRGYVDGYSVPQLAERFGVNAAAISWRSREHGWREERAAAEAEARDLSFELIPPRGAPGAASDPDATSTTAWTCSATTSPARAPVGGS
jgi:transposase-like protein